MQPVNEVFAQLWPQARCSNLLDDSLSSDLQAQGLTPAMINRMVSLAGYMAAQGAQAVLFTCSAFGLAIDAAKKALPIPVLKPNEAMFDQALALCEALGKPGRIGLLTTFAPASVSMQVELQQAIAQCGLPVAVENACATGALELLQAGDAAGHDRLVREAAIAMPACDVVLLGQFSMAYCQAELQTVLQRPVLTSPASAVRRLQAALAIPQTQP